jgi:fluoride ion exporter CrcB/FEX
MALVYNHLGVIGLKLWKLACSTGMLVMLALGIAETGAPPRLQLGLLAVATIATTLFIQLRPQLFTFVLFAAMLALLARHTYREGAPLWMLIPLMALWANLHGGFIIGIVALWVYTGVAGLQDLLAQRSKNRAAKLGLIAAASTLATLLTPYGTDTWIAVIVALRNPFTRSIIDDWKPAVAYIWNGGHINFPFLFFSSYAFALMAALPLSFGLAPSGRDLPLVAIALIMSLGACVAVRNLPLAGIACAVPVAYHAALWQAGKGRKAAVEPSRIFSSMTRWSLAVLAIVLAVGREGLFSKLLPTDAAYPSGPVQFMKRHGLHGNVLNHFGWGEYLIWHLAPSSKVFIDGRYDTVYPLSVIGDYVKFHFGQPGATTVLRSYPHDFVLVPAPSIPYGLLEKSLGWTLIFQDHDSALFARQGSPAAKLPGVPVISAATSQQYFP